MKVRITAALFLLPALWPLSAKSVSLAMPPTVTLLGNVTFLSARQGWLESSTSPGYSPPCNGTTNHLAACDRATTTLYATADGGAHWRRIFQFAGPTVAAANGLPTVWFHAFDPRHLLILPPTLATRGSLYASDDGGVHWRTLQGPPGAPASETDIAFTGPRELWWLAHEGAAMGSEVVSVYRSNDGGGHWLKLACTSLAATPNPSTCRGGFELGGHKDNIVFADGATGYMVNNNNAGSPFLYVSHDSGAHWESLSPRPPANVRGLYPAGGSGSFVEYGRPVFFGRNGLLPMHATSCDGNNRCHDANYVLVTRDAGASWSAARRFPRGITTQAAAEPLWQPLTPSIWYVAGARRLWVTTDSGHTWRASTPPLPTGYVLARLQFVSRSTGELVVAQIDAADGIARTARLLRTVDGGRTWSSLRIPG